MLRVRLYLQSVIKFILKYSSLAIVILLTACTEPDCIDKGGEFIGIGFYDEQTGEVEEIRINSLQLEGIDSLLASEVDNVAAVILPINPDTDQLTAYFDTEFGRDTLVIGYERTVSLISEDCGAEIIFNSVSIVRNDFDSISVVNTSTELNFLDATSFNENIRIFN